MNDLNFDDERILFTPLILYIDYIYLLHNDYLKKTYKDLTPSDVTYLINIFYHQNCSQRDLAELLFVSESNVAQIIKKLEKKEYIVRVPDDKNKSRKIINLTSKGKNTVFMIIKGMYEWEGEFFKDYNPEDVENFKKMLYEYSQKTINSI
ncbi:MarR family winged helix-turn-helix transcriptional regulator [uncultured Methanobrevibacter sp.]|uniref:MarR family winged helix-turn-helix transcriptional regulator n=1 Tax=uncultured Methanobrevibacter sp. TaxID=253161 RepID=UPI0025DB4241|nr:MarR family transcriptional regulator [uncultured Methanobrevibacter sp.]